MSPFFLLTIFWPNNYCRKPHHTKKCLFIESTALLPLTLENFDVEVLPMCRLTQRETFLENIFPLGLNCTIPLGIQFAAYATLRPSFSLALGSSSFALLLHLQLRYHVKIRLVESPLQQLIKFLIFVNH